MVGRPIRLSKLGIAREDLGIGGFLSEDPSVCGVLMTKNDVEHFRSEAKECRQLAERATSPIDEAWLRLAEDWIKLAEEVERRQAGGP